MPIFDDEKLKIKIEDGSIRAITLDTNIFDRYNCNLGFPLLRKLDQFVASGISVLISEVIYREIAEHIAREAAETQRALKKALKEHSKRWEVEREIMIRQLFEFHIESDPREMARTHLDVFCWAVKATHIKSVQSIEQAQAVLDSYFNVDAPFESRKPKKTEFPDAFALLSLEAYAKDRGIMVVCVSNDSGWIRFCSQSNWLICVENLPGLMALFNKVDSFVADRTIEKIREESSVSLLKAIEQRIGWRLDGADFQADGWSSVSFETEPVDATLKSIEWASAGDAKVVAYDLNSVTFTTIVNTNVDFEAIFYFSTRDGIDRDWIALGSENVSKEQSIDFSLIVTVPRKDDLEDSDIEIELDTKKIKIDFGIVEPFQGDDPEFDDRF